MWWLCLLTDRDEMSNLHRGHYRDASYQVSVVAMFVNRSGRNEQSSEDIPYMIPTKFWWQLCLLTDLDEMSNLHRGHSIDASYQVLVHLAKQFQRRRFKKNHQSETRIAILYPELSFPLSSTTSLSTLEKQSQNHMTIITVFNHMIKTSSYLLTACFTLSSILSIM